MKVSELKFKTHTADPTGTQATAFFGNGYGASVITGDMFYTSEGAPFEVAVLSGTKDAPSITYDTPITENVLGHLTEGDVNNILARIEALQPRNPKENAK